MKTIIRVIALTCLMAVALTMATFTLAGFRDKEAVPTGQLVLGSYNGRVSIFDGGDMKTPLEVTDIDISALREADRSRLESGMEISSQEELLSLLEDLGS